MRRLPPMAQATRLTAGALAPVLSALLLSGNALAQQAPAPQPAAPAPAAPAAPAQSKPNQPASTGAAASGGTTTPAPTGAATPAKPPDKKTREQARKQYTAGEKAFNAGDYPTALTSFQAAYELIPTPHAEYWIAASLDKLNKPAEAVDAYARFLANPEAGKVGDDKVADAKARHEALRATLDGQVTLTIVPPNAQVSVDGVPQPAGASPLTLKLPPGAHRVTVAAEGHEPKDIEVIVRGGETTEQTVTLIAAPLPEPQPAAPPPPPPAPPPPPPPPAPERSKVPAYVTLGIAGASAIVGTVFGIQALSAKSDYDDRPTSDAADDVERNALIADMAFGVAVTLGVTGVVLLTSSDDPPPETAARPLPKRASLRVVPYASPTGGGASARWTF